MMLRGGGPESALTQPDDSSQLRDDDERKSRVARWHPSAVVAVAAVSGYVVICLMFTAVGLLVTHQLGALSRWDQSVNRWFAENRTAGTNSWTSDATKVANTSGILIALVIAAIVLLVLRHRWAVLVLLIALCLELLTFLTVNYLVDRPRPDVVRLGSLPSTSSFPSGHTAAMVALYGGLAVLITARFRSHIVGVICWVVAVLATATIGFARVYRGMHYPSDVMAGALLGLAALGVAVVAARGGQRASTERRHAHAQKHSFNPEVAA
jgi:membrane-associated phospholipid phosphatase